MKRDALKIGARTKSSRPQFEAQFNRPESVADCLKLVAGSEQVATSLFTRGYTIWLQDRIGRPMFEAGASVQDIQKALDAAIPGQSKGVGRPKAVPTATIPSGKKAFTPAEVAEMLAKQGFKVVSE